MIVEVDLASALNFKLVDLSTVCGLNNKSIPRALVNKVSTGFPAAHYAVKR